MMIADALHERRSVSPMRHPVQKNTDDKNQTFIRINRLMNSKKPKIEYFDIQKNWRRLRPHVESDEAQDILVRDFNMFTFGRWKRKFKKGMFPTDFESCDWQEHHKGKRPEYWRYTKHAACHWLVNFNLCVATRAIPYKQWRILTSQKHSTVWDGKGLLGLHPVSLTPA